MECSSLESGSASMSASREGIQIKSHLNSDERGERNERREGAEGEGWSSRFPEDSDDREELD